MRFSTAEVDTNLVVATRLAAIDRCLSVETNLGFACKAAARRLAFAAFIVAGLGSRFGRSNLVGLHLGCLYCSFAPAQS